jgi:hypothetical protein
MRKGKMWIFEEVVHQDDEFAHAGDQGDFWLFTGGAEPQVKGFEDGVVADGAEDGHVESGADGGSSARDVTLAALASAVLIVGSDTRQRSGALFGEGSEFGHFGQDDGGCSGAYARDRIEALGFGFQFSVLSDELDDGFFALVDLLLKNLQESAALLLAEAFKVMRAAVGFGDEGFNELSAPNGELAQGFLLS